MLTTDTAFAATTAERMMSVGLFAAPAETSLGRLAEVMARRQIHAVVLGDPDRDPTRVTTALDLVRALHDRADTENPAPYARSLPVVRPQGRLAEIAATMASADSAHVLVRPAHGALPLGIVSALDVAAVVGGLYPARLRADAGTGSRRPRRRLAFERLTVADAMHEGVIACPALTPLPEVGAMLADRRVHCVIVPGVPRPGPGWGVLADLDLVRAVAAGTLGVPAAAIAGTEPLTVPEADPLRSAAARMVEHDVEHLVALRDGVPTGLVSTLDVLAAFAGKPSGGRR